MTTRFLLLWGLGMLGVVSLAWMPLPLPPGAPEPPLPTGVIKLISLLTIAVWLGNILSPQVQLAAPATTAIAKGQSPLPILQAQLLPGLVGGLVGGAALIGIHAIASAGLPSDFMTKATALGETTPFLTRLLYGGITEELLLRWGLMTLLVWGGWRFVSHRPPEPPLWIILGAIAVAAFLFAVGHLPLAVALGHTTPGVILYILGANTVFGLIAGYLYWRSGLEAAMLAHMVVHGVLVLAGQWIRIG